MPTVINMNAQCRVPLTEWGKSVFELHCRRIDAYAGRQLTKEYRPAVYDTTLWELFQIFGPETRMGVKTCFVNNEIILL